MFQNLSDEKGSVTDGVSEVKIMPRAKSGLSDAISAVAAAEEKESRLRNYSIADYAPPPEFSNLEGGSPKRSAVAPTDGVSSAVTFILNGFMSKKGRNSFTETEVKHLLRAASEFDLAINWG